MKIHSHLDLINAVTAAVASLSSVSGDKFTRGVCFGYAATFLEALHSETLDVFWSRIRGELRESLEARHNFFFGMAIHNYPDVFSEKFLPGISLYQQDFCVTSPVVSKSEYECLLHHAGYYDINLLEESLNMFLRVRHQFNRNPSFILRGGKHAIALHITESMATIANATKPSEPQFYFHDAKHGLRSLAENIIKALVIAKTENSDTINTARLVIAWQWFCLKKNASFFAPMRDAVKIEPALNQVPTYPLATYPDMTNNLWIAAVIRSQELALLRSLLQINASLKNVKIGGFDLVCFATVFGLISSLETLLSEGLNPNTMDDTGWRPLHFAVLNCQLPALQLLFKYGADDNLKNKIGERPWDSAKRMVRSSKQESIRKSYEKIAEFFESKASLKHF